MKIRLISFICISITLCFYNPSYATDNDTAYKKAGITTDDNAGLKLPAGFSAVKVADGLGQARHITVTKNGYIYVKLSHLKNGKGIYFLNDKNGDGKADVITGFGTFTGTGIGIRDHYLYASSDEAA